MLKIVIYTLASVLIVSLVSLVGILAFAFKREFHKKTLLLLVSLSAGTLFGSAFMHLLPEAVERSGFGAEVSLIVIVGIIVFFVLEKFIHWHHCHGHNPQEHHHQPTHLAPLNLSGDAIHNFLDGLIIAGAYIVSIPVGIAATIAVVLHEIPQEIADFGILLYSGMSRAKALLLNFLSAAVAVVGAAVGLSLRTDMFIDFILPFAAGGFVYIAGSNLIPEMHKECGLKDSFWHFFALLLGLLITYLLAVVG